MVEETLSTTTDWQSRLREMLCSSSPSARVAVVGVGHPMKGDDYVGSFIIKSLMRQIRTDKVILFDAEDGVEWVISRLGRSNLRVLIIIDACEMNARSGDVALVPLAATNYPFFRRQGIPLKLLTSKLLPKVEAWFLAVQRDRLGLNKELSQPVSSAARLISGVIAATLGGQSDA